MIWFSVLVFFLLKSDTLRIDLDSHRDVTFVVDVLLAV